ncbi:hypothetical protein FFLO_05809 [Filobasidium floriforme]|uniref:Uncharacterized protein n=1 Tax=Filobasidium floriforme TaxID=5210 RepID=A0A8K0NMV4_9TREE|nr:uncharacterized protein HD553DRAFT_326855 [Filobasidium floriforme]KAG7529047.1 hypothetical protein FFLO_05809 [Filobasidium floriforme]KAH8078681.1 hypothetical protein HD553DRAFT_326855 [Filobasidium floriforme]
MIHTAKDLGIYESLCYRIREIDYHNREIIGDLYLDADESIGEGFVDRICNTDERIDEPNLDQGGLKWHLEVNVYPVKKGDRVDVIDAIKVWIKACTWTELSRAELDSGSDLSSSEEPGTSVVTSAPSASADDTRTLIVRDFIPWSCILASDVTYLGTDRRSRSFPLSEGYGSYRPRHAQSENLAQTCKEARQCLTPNPDVVLIEALLSLAIGHETEI